MQLNWVHFCGALQDDATELEAAAWNRQLIACRSYSLDVIIIIKMGFF